MRCEVVHTVPGRLRLRYPAPWLKSRHASVERAFRAIPGVRGVTPRATTGSVLIATELPLLLRAGRALRRRRLNGEVLEASTLLLLIGRGNPMAGALLAW